MGIQMPSGHIDFRTLFQRQDSFLIFQQNHRSSLGCKACFHIFPGTHDLRAFLGIQIGVFKKAHPEHQRQDPGRGLLHPLAHDGFAVFLTTQIIGLQHRVLPAAAAEHIHTVG